MTKKTAVVLYGFMRTYKKTANSLIRNVVIPNNADLFVFTYANEGVSVLSNTTDINKQKAKLSNQQDTMGKVVTRKKLSDVYGKYLKDCKINSYNRDKFLHDSEGTFSPLFPIERFYSLYFNISGAINLLNNYVKKRNVKYDAVILARPDLMFYSMIDLKSMDMKVINIPSYGGNLNCFEQPQPYYACYYENVERCEYIPYHQVVFTDQLIISSFETMSKLSTLYSNLPKYNENLLPVCHPETVLYYHLAYCTKTAVETHDIQYKILRNNNVNATNEILQTRQRTVNKIEKYHTKVKNEYKNFVHGLLAIYKLPVALSKYIFYKITKRK